MRRPIRIAFTDFPSPFNVQRIRRLLETRFDLQVDATSPEYVLFSIMEERDFLLYPDAVRIFFAGENLRPDFNLCDYAFAYDWMEFGDRYRRWPNYQFYEQFHELIVRGRSGDVAREKTRFCNFIYTNPRAHPARSEMFHRLSRYKRVDSPGACFNNLPEGLGTVYQGDWHTEKVRFQQAYKFTIAFENSSTAGYTTEKIVHALAADTIPIYWGNPLVAREFNPERFLNCHDYESLDAVVKEVRRLDQDDDAFLAMLARPFFPSGTVPSHLRDEAVLEQFEHIFSQPREQAYRRNRIFWGRRYEQRRRRERQVLRLLRPLAALRTWVRKFF